MIHTASDLDTELHFVSTGIPPFDKLMGGGFARKKITVLSGSESVGKSTTAYSAIVGAQALGLGVLLYDVEKAYDRDYCESLGIDTDRLDVLLSEHAEDGLQELLEAIDSGKYQYVIIDSIGALQTRIAAQKQIGEKTIGGQASLVAEFIRKAVWKVDTNDVALVCITHEFTDIMSAKVMASGGKKLMYHASVHARLKPKFGAILKQGETKIGKVIVMEMKKNKLLAVEGKEAESQFIYGESFSKVANLLDEAIEKGIIEKRGNTYWMGTEKLGIISKVRLLLKEETFSEKLQRDLHEKEEQS